MSKMEIPRNNNINGISNDNMQSQEAIYQQKQLKDLKAIASKERNRMQKKAAFFVTEESILYAHKNCNKNRNYLKSE